MDRKLVAEARKAVLDRYGDLPIPEQAYLVLMLPRSGSNLLCYHLEKIGFGRPIEWFHYNQKRWESVFGSHLDLSDPYVYIREALRYGTVNGVFGSKLNWAQFEIFLKKARALLDPAGIQLNDAEAVEVFIPAPKYIHLKRRNKIRQAVSYARARQNGIWMVKADQDDTYKDYTLPAVYDREHIECLFDNLLAFDLSWEQYLTHHDLPALEIWYEDLAKDYVNKMLEVYTYLGISRDEVIDPPLKRQADSVSQVWVQRFQEETDWLQDETITEALQAGDFFTVYLQRTMGLVRMKELLHWSKMPARRFRNIRKLLLRIRHKIGI
jgi:LPS sulfotransferase NodH